MSCIVSEALQFEWMWDDALNLKKWQWSIKWIFVKSFTIELQFNSIQILYYKF